MNKSKLLNMLGVVVLTVFTVLTLGSLKADPASVGGTFNPTTVEFSGGITTSTIQTSTYNPTATLVAGTTTAGLYSYAPVLTYTADTTLTNDQTGSTINMGTAGLDITLPSPTTSAGVRYRFVVSAAFATTNMTIVAGTADTIEGSLIVAGAVVDCTANDAINFVATSEDVGDFVEVFSNGTNWVIGSNQTLTASNTTCTG